MESGAGVGVAKGGKVVQLYRGNTHPYTTFQKYILTLLHSMINIIYPWINIIVM
jgi:hypothetical protein